MSHFSALLFDLDGTLIDSAPDICASVNQVLETMNRSNVSVATVKELVGFSAPTLVKKVLELTGPPGSQDEIDFLLSSFLETYRRHPCDHTVVFPGVHQALELFTQAEIQLAICTNKPEITCFPVIEALGLQKYFSTIICGDTLEHRKPDPRHVLHTLDKMGAALEEAAFIGDNEIDVNAAKAAGLPCVCVTYGYCRLPYESLGADALIDHFEELDGALGVISGKQ